MNGPQTDIGDARRSALARCVALAAVAFDVAWPTIQYKYEIYSSIINREVAILIVLTTILCLHDGNAPSLGFRLSPVQGWRYWIRLALAFGACIAVILVFYLGLWWVMGWQIPIYRIEITAEMGFLFCIYAPLVEEIVYRSLLITAIAPTCGQWGTIAVSGVLFALIHVLAGNPSPENQVAGFMLAWAFLKSRTILVPMAMHAGGNFLAFASHVASWYGYWYSQS